MANWCYQNVIVGGSRSDRRKFVRDLLSTETDSEPIHFLYLLSGNDQELLDDRSHDFSIWDDGRSSTLTQIYFESAWSPAFDLLRAVSRTYPTLVFGIYYSEESQAFVGWKIFHAGIQVEGEEVKVEDNSPPALFDVYEKYTHDEITDDEWYESLSEWYSEQCDDAGNECIECVKQYATWVRIETRREKEGRFPREFVYEPQ